MIKLLLPIVITLITLQLKSQEINTRQEAIKLLDEKQNRGFFIMEKVKRIDGVEEEICRRLIGYTLENEYLIYKMAPEQHQGGQVTYVNPKLLLINLTDSLSLEKIIGEKNTKAEKYFSLYISYKNYKICMTSHVDVETKFQRNVLAQWNSESELLYKAMRVLKSTLNPDEKAETKLFKFKNEYLKTDKTKEITEEQRKYIVQANAANDAKDYKSALLLYRKALDVNKFSYPEAYFNMALILSYLEHYYQATYAMQAYLILAPNAEDARKAQDKIYEWELNIKQ